MNGLVGFWEEYNPQEGPPFLHPTDREYMDAHGGLRQLWAHPDEDAQAYLQHFAERHEHPDRFHLALRPFPFAGNLETADVVILMLNPRFVLSEYYANAHVGYINALQSTMTQTFDGIGFPFMWLDPQFSWCDGFVYLEGKLRQVLQAVAGGQRFNGSYWQALQDASSRIALIELVAYASINFPERARRLPSVKIAREAAMAAVGRGAVVVGYGKGKWEGLHPGDRVEIQNSRSLTLTCENRAGVLVRDRLNDGPGV